MFCAKPISRGACCAFHFMLTHRESLNRFARILKGYLSMNEPTIICPNCKSEIMGSLGKDDNRKIA